MGNFKIRLNNRAEVEFREARRAENGDTASQRGIVIKNTSSGELADMRM